MIIAFHHSLFSSDSLSRLILASQPNFLLCISPSSTWSHYTCVYSLFVCTGVHCPAGWPFPPDNLSSTDPDLSLVCSLKSTWHHFKGSRLCPLRQYIGWKLEPVILFDSLTCTCISHDVSVSTRKQVFFGHKCVLSLSGCLQSAYLVLCFHNIVYVFQGVLVQVFCAPPSFPHFRNNQRYVCPVKYGFVAYWNILQ